ncbi:hypothetical protein FRX31_017761 [Thalictrum thalictroides]|uniref:Uncharacterized protein n=1 Tax=Thalictrum thalictroides TaxID=46969 RepID=A0A7J6W6J8_THATH|nr:hypothetical protein FRX31_017761 [Thalictrum thalictroides]
MGGKVEMNLENGSNTYQDVTNIISHEHTIDNWTRNEMDGIEIVADTTVRDENAINSTSANDQDFIDDSNCDEYLTDESNEDDFIED